jgi:hypothetical protein
MTYTEETASVQVVIEESEETNEKTRSQRGEKLHGSPRNSSLVNAIKRHKTATAMVLVAVTTAVLAGILFAKPLMTWWFKPPSIAVLPMVNATGNPDNEYIADGLTESLITSLNQINTPGKLPRLLVTAQSTVLLF